MAAAGKDSRTWPWCHGNLEELIQKMLEESSSYKYIQEYVDEQVKVVSSFAEDIMKKKQKEKAKQDAEEVKINEEDELNVTLGSLTISPISNQDTKVEYKFVDSNGKTIKHGAIIDLAVDVKKSVSGSVKVLNHFSRWKIAMFLWRILILDIIPDGGELTVTGDQKFQKITESKQYFTIPPSTTFILLNTDKNRFWEIYQPNDYPNEERTISTSWATQIFEGMDPKWIKEHFHLLKQEFKEENWEQVISKMLEEVPSMTTELMKLVLVKREQFNKGQGGWKLVLSNFEFAWMHIVFAWKSNNP